MTHAETDPTAIVEKITVVVKQNGRGGFIACILLDNSDGTFTEMEKKFSRTTIGKVRKEIYDYKQEWISRGQPADSITIKYL